MNLFLTLIFLLILSVNSFVNKINIGRINLKKVYSIDKVNNIQDNLNKIQDNIVESTSKTNVFFPFDSNDINTHFNTIANNNIYDTIINYQEHYEECFKHLGQNIVIKISSMLPNFDSVGHKVLHANNELIIKILSNPHLTDTLKKSLILTAIRLAQYGDNMGSAILELYYKIVDSCL